MDKKRIVGFTGTQVGMTEKQKITLGRLIERAKVSEFHHGDCIGADEEADNIVRLVSTAVIHIHPPIDDRAQAWCFMRGEDVEYPPKPYLDRNHDIVDACDILYATPKGFKEELRSGTWATIRYARKKGKKIKIIFPDGSIGE